MTMRCNCKDIVPQSQECYDQMIDLGKTSVDPCLAGEVWALWGLGIETTGCCCGHNINDWRHAPFIGVKEEYIQTMKDLGYEVQLNTCGYWAGDFFLLTQPKREDSFKPKSL